MRRSLWLSAAVLVSLCTLFSAPAAAYTLRSGTPDSTAITGLGRGLKLIGLENMFLLNYQKQGDASATLASYYGGPAFRIFLVKNFSLGLTGMVFYNYAKNSGSQFGAETEIGGLGLVTLDYYIPTGGGLFFKPGVGIGGFYGRHSTPTAPNTTLGSDIYGGAARVSLTLVFFASEKIDIKAGLDVLINFGRHKLSDGSGTTNSFTSVLGGFNVGFDYAF